MRLAIDVAVLEKALIDQDKDYGLHCRNIWDYACQFSFIHVCFDVDGEIDKVYDARLSKSTEYRKWYTEHLPRRYSDGQPYRYDGNQFLSSNFIKEDDHLRRVLSVAKASNGMAFVENSQVLESAKKLRVSCHVPDDETEKIRNEIKRWLRKKIELHYNLDEIRLLCANIDVDYDDLPGETKTVKILELVEYCERRSRLDKLMQQCREDRPGCFDTSFSPIPFTPDTSSSS